MTGRELTSFEGHPHWTSWVDVSPDGKRLVSADLSGAVVVWDLPRSESTSADMAARLAPRLPFVVRDGVLVPRALR
jgi:WD40 repeat protein